MTAMEIQELTVNVDGYPIVNDLTLAVEEGERLGVVGDYQDALFVMNVLCGLTLPDSGEIWIYNMPPRQALQRGLVDYVQSLNSDTNASSCLILLLPHGFVPQVHAHANVIVHPLPHIIETFYELIRDNYKFISLSIRRNKSL